MRSTLLFAGAALAAVFMSSCCIFTGLATRRDLYNPQCVNGPYTRMLHDGIPRVTTTTTVVTTSASEGKAVIPPQ